MKEMIFCILMCTLSLSAQEYELFEPYSSVEVPEVSLDLNGDGIPELTSGVLTIGTDDVPSSSGSHTWYLKTEPHCTMLYTEHQWSTNTQVASLPIEGTLPEIREYHHYWSKQGMIELTGSGYGSAASGWDPIYPYGQEFNCIAVRFEVGDRIYVATVSWQIREGTCEFSRLETRIWLEGE